MGLLTDGENEMVKELKDYIDRFEELGDLSLDVVPNPSRFVSRLEFFDPEYRGDKTLGTEQLWVLAKVVHELVSIFPGLLALLQIMFYAGAARHLPKTDQPPTD